jgi:hypothetical protein
VDATATVRLSVSTSDVKSINFHSHSKVRRGAL